MQKILLGGVVPLQAQFQTQTQTQTQTQVQGLPAGVPPLPQERNPGRDDGD